MWLLIFDIDLDAEPTEAEISKVMALVQAELESTKHGKPHPDSLSSKPKSTYLSSEMSQYVTEVGESRQVKGIDLARYSSDLQDSNNGIKLKHAYTALCYAQDRYENLTLLSEYGRNQWLIGNDNLEQDLKQLELEVENERRLIDTINAERRAQQSNVKTTFDYLESRWREGIRNVVDVNIACLQLQQESQVPVSESA